MFSKVNGKDAYLRFEQGEPWGVIGRAYGVSGQTARRQAQAWYQHYSTAEDRAEVRRLRLERAGVPAAAVNTPAPAAKPNPGHKHWLPETAAGHKQVWEIQPDPSGQVWRAKPVSQDVKRQLQGLPAQGGGRRAAAAVGRALRAAGGIRRSYAMAG